MCGRYASARKKHELMEEFEVELDGVPDTDLRPDYNVAPTKEVYAVMSRVPKVEGESRTDRPIRQIRVVRWGLVPSWAKDPSIGSRLINARVETVAEKPAYRRALASRRCLLPADGYFEWMPVEGKKKQPYFIHPGDGGVLAMAGLYEFWKDPSRADDDPLKWLCTCTVITTTAEDKLGHIHDRMPMMVERERWAEWLDPRVTDARGLLVPAGPDRLVAHPVSTSVNDVRNNGPELVDPIEPEGGDTSALF
ncbi:SOS response-associated peptidase [Planotetraspora sp. A-T 1434]|uniref:SOS response-associated peptidase n=1 Tax=Planotetraspora sp. A-T 1434 TaxID=2979219 RepID=UPI0021C0CA70|nr:SOS response-associated peptidase [Planotetraspora sp. A-T 1434]MCT9931228.1 SOS response-associated peptidase [Planotetraspora sp. A-T 1434]